MLRTIALAAVLFMSACATAPPPYGAALTPAGPGYSETQIESGRYFVTFRAPNGAEPSRLEDYALLRAAELTLQSGHQWFWLDRRTLDGQASRGSGTSIGVGVGAGSWGRRSGGSVGVGVNFPLGGGGRGSARAAMVEIRMGQGEKPDAVNAYDARSTADSIRARLSTSAR
jgi:hypothetical protein